MAMARKNRKVAQSYAFFCLYVFYNMSLTIHYLSCLIDVSSIRQNDLLQQESVLLSKGVQKVIYCTLVMEMNHIVVCVTSPISISGVYLPLLWEPSFCSRSPIALGYTRGHFCALVPPEPVLLANNTCRYILWHSM